MTVRLTRKEQQARTRSSLLASAVRVLADKGLHRASIDDITADAGFTKGAFYANFASKEELFLVILDEHFAERLAAIEALTAGRGELADHAARAGQDFIDALRGDEAWSRLFLELSSYATRHEAFREQFVARNAALRVQIAVILDRRAAEAGLTPTVSSDLIAWMLFSMARGVVGEQLLDPDLPDDLLAQMLRLFFNGVAATSAPGPVDDATGRPA